MPKYGTRRGHNRTSRPLLLAVALAVGAICCTPAVQAAVPAAVPAKLSERCVPFTPPPPAKTMVDYFNLLDGLSNSQLAAMYYGAPPANMTQGFPLAGCTLGWVPGSFIGSQVARVPALNMGWSGKCFGFSYNTTTRTPTNLTNEFSLRYEDVSLPQQLRMGGVTSGAAVVSWSPASVDPQTRGAVWAFDYSRAALLFDAVLNMEVNVDSIRDEVRVMAPGAVIGRMYVTGPSGQTRPMPIFFMLFQACTADGRFPTVPAARQLPRVGLQR